jgi:hypothetical protein
LGSRLVLRCDRFPRRHRPGDWQPSTSQWCRGLTKRWSQCRPTCI